MCKVVGYCCPRVIVRKGQTKGNGGQRLHASKGKIVDEDIVHVDEVVEMCMEQRSGDA